MQSHRSASMRNAETSLDAEGGSGPKLVCFAPEQREVEARIAPERLLKQGFHELLGGGPGDECASLGIALSMSWEACASTGKSLCVCMLESEAQERGRLYGSGLAALGIAAERAITVTAAREKDLLWALEEALTSGAFGAVVGMLGIDERLYTFPQSRRLKLRSAAAATPFFLLRHWQSGGATAATGRWRVTALPSRSAGKHGDFRLPGPSRLQLRLERMASLPPQSWEIEFDATRHLHLVPLLEHGPTGKAIRRRRSAA
ncbi:MAG: ImuA family protein [Rhodomicrobiaceae bacterium]